MIPTLNIGMNRPDPGTFVGTWHIPMNGNSDIVDALFAATRSTSPGGTGHVHNGLPGQGPVVDHNDLMSKGTKTHDQLETDLSAVSGRVTAIEGDYCADATCGGGGGGARDIQPPLHYTDNFTTPQGTRLAAMDWMVSSTGGTDMQSSGHSAYLSTAMLLPQSETYAAMVKCQIPHSTAQRVTFHVARLELDALLDGDSFTMVMCLFGTHILGSSLIHYCGIKMVITVSRMAGLYTVTRIALAEPRPNEVYVLKQDSTPGLGFDAAEALFRGCHEFSIDEDGGVWYYHNRAPVWILPSGTASRYYPSLIATLLGLNEPMYGAMGFGLSWNTNKTAEFDFELAWLTVDSKSNVEEDYITVYADPGNTPVPFDPTPGALCCGGLGPQIGAMEDMGDGLQLKVIACTTDPWDGVLLANGDLLPCGLLAAPTGGDPGPATTTEGLEFTREIPIVNMTPGCNTSFILSGDEAFDYVHVEPNRMGVTITGRLKAGSFGLPNPTITVFQKTDITNTYGPVTICLIAAATLNIDSITAVDPITLLPLANLPEGGYYWLKILTTGYPSSGPFPVLLAPADLAIVGSISSVDQRYLRAPNELWARVLTNDLQPPYVPGYKVDVTVTRGVEVDTDSKPVMEAAPIINGIWVTADTGGGPTFTLLAGATITFDMYGGNFDDGGPGYPYLSLPVGSLHTIVAQPAYVGPGQLAGAQITLDPTGLLLDPLSLIVTNPSLVPSGPPQVVARIGDFGGWPPLTTTLTLNGTVIPAPVEGLWQHVSITGVPAMPPYAPMYDLEVSVGGVPMPAGTPNIKNYTCTLVSLDFDLLIPFGFAGLAVGLSVAKYQAANQYITVLGLIQAEPAPVGVPTVGPLYPGATGTIFITGAGNVFLPNLKAWGNPATDLVVTNVTITVPFSSVAIDYTVPLTATPGTAVSFTLENFLGTVVGSVPIGNVSQPPVVIDSIEFPSCDLTEGRTGVLAVLHGHNFDVAATVSVTAGPVSQSAPAVVVSSTEINVWLMAPVLTGGVAYTLRVDNPTTFATVAGAVLFEPIPSVSLIVKPPTPGVGRVVELAGNNLFVADANTPSDIVFSITHTAGMLTPNKAKGMYTGTLDVTGTAGQTLSVSVTTPGGRVYNNITQMVIRAPSMTPIPTSVIPASPESYDPVIYRADGTNFDDVAVVRFRTAGLVPIGGSDTVNATITAMTSDWATGQITLPGGVVGNVYALELYDATLALLATLPAAFTAAKGDFQPAITNKAGMAILTGAGAGNIVLFQLDPGTPILSSAAWSGVNVTGLTAIDVSGGAGTAWQLSWTNGAAGPAEIRVTNTGIVPNRFDCKRFDVV